MSKTVKIGYTSETASDYAKALRKVNSLEALKKLVNFYSPLTDDAIAEVNKMSNDSFKEFIADLPKFENARGKEAEVLTDMWGKIVLPREMLRIGMMAQHFNVPFGLAFIRDRELTAPTSNKE